MNDLLLTFLQDIYYAERRILKALPKMAKAAESEELAKALMQHREETQEHVERLQHVFEELGKRARGQTCEAVNGIVEEGEEMVEEFEKGPVRDAGILANAQAVEHYEMARYGTIIAWAKACGLKESVLEETLAEEKKADSLLNQIATGSLNKRAAQKAP
ncbi:MAG TPA: ferritin-like domain-containing protein [Acetobacteraceae bacterium]